MQINYWSCEYNDYEEYWDGENEERCYGCKHPKGDGVCALANKYGDLEDDCLLLDD